MKALFLLLVAISFGFVQVENCEEFYHKQFFSREIKSKVTKKEETNSHYVLYVKNADTGKKEESIKLLKNKKGKDIYTLINDSTMIRKQKNDITLRVVVFQKDKSIDVRTFFDLCE